MQVTKVKGTKQAVEMKVSADETELLDIKRQVFNALRPRVSSKGFRPGKAPDNVLERELGTEVVHKEFLDQSLSQLFSQLLQQEKLTIIGQPAVNVSKFVPYSTLDFTAELELRPEIKLPDLKSLEVTAQPQEVTDERIDEVLRNMRSRVAVKVDVDRPARDGDEAVIDFDGKDAKGADVVGASGKGMPVTLGSGTFIPGFEKELIGLKKGDKKSFTVTFPKDYHVPSLRNAKVTFDVILKGLKEVQLPEVNEAFAKTSSPFANLKELKEDIAKQLEEEYGRQADKAKREEVVGQLLDKVKLEIPPKFLEQVVEEVRQDFLRSLSQRGLTEEEFYSREATSKEAHEKTEIRPVAERRVKGSLILSEVARAEKLTVSREELEAYLKFLQEQYKQDAKALEQLDRPEVREDIAMQMLTERTIDRLVSLANQQ